MMDDLSSVSSQCDKPYEFKKEIIVPMLLPPGFSYLTLNAIGLLSISGVAPLLSKTIKDGKIYNIFDDPNYFDLLLNKLILNQEPSLMSNWDEHRVTMLKALFMSSLNDSNGSLFQNIGKAYNLFVPECQSSLSSRFIPSRFYYIPTKDIDKQKIMTFRQNGPTVLREDYLLRYFLGSDSSYTPTLVIFQHFADDSDYRTFIVQYNKIEEVTKFNAKDYNIYFMVYQKRNTNSNQQPCEIKTNPPKIPPSMDQLSDDKFYPLIRNYIKYQRSLVLHVKKENQKMSDFLSQSINPIFYLWSNEDPEDTSSIEEKVDKLTKFQYFFYYDAFNHLNNFEIHDDDVKEQIESMIKDYYQLTMLAPKIVSLCEKFMIILKTKVKPPQDFLLQCKLILNIMPIKSSYISSYVVQLLILIANKFKSFETQLKEFLFCCITNLKDFWVSQNPQESEKYQDPKFIEDSALRASDSAANVHTPYVVELDLKKQKLLAMPFKYFKPDFRDTYITNINGNSSKCLAIEY